MTRKSWIARTGVFTVLLVVLAVAGTAITGAFAQTDRAAGPVAKKWKIALSNSFIGNKWRIEMENLFKGAGQMAPYKDQIDCSVYNSGNDVSKHFFFSSRRRHTRCSRDWSSDVCSSD